MNKNRKILVIAVTFVVFLFLVFLAFSRYKKTSRPHLTVVGYVLMADGLGRQSAELIDILKNDIDIGFKATRNTSIKGTPKKIRNIIKNKKRPMGKVIVYEDWLGWDGNFFKDVIKGQKKDHEIRIAYSMFESSTLPTEWVHSLNTCFDLVVVPDSFLIETYKNSGVTIPIFELPLGLNLEPLLSTPLKAKKGSPFTFTNLSALSPRKNQLKLIKAFHAAFGNSQDVRLRLNGRYGDSKYIEEIKNEIHQLGATNIDFTQMVMDKEFYLKTFQNADCYVSISSGEGFSIQPREAMALGIPTIVTDNTGQSTICKSTLAYVIPSANPVPAFYPELNNRYGFFYDCEIKDVVQGLKDMYDNYDHYLEKRAAAKKWAKQYSYTELKPLYLGLIKPRKIALGNTNKITPDCLFTDSEELCKKFNKLIGTSFENQ